jgi:hypothetical protein
MNDGGFLTNMMFDSPPAPLFQRGGLGGQRILCKCYEHGMPGGKSDKKVFVMLKYS